MKKQNYEVEILVNGRSVKEYFKGSKTYIEGREGNDFSIRIKNNGYKKIVAIPSVDGLSVMDGKEASHDSQGYIISGYDSMTIDGWRISDDEVKQFYFTNPEDSYAERKNDGGNLGVIGVAIFREKDMPVPPIIKYYNFPDQHGSDCECSKCQPWRGRRWPFPHHDPYYFGGDLTINTAGNASLMSMCSNNVEAGNKNFRSQELGTGFGDNKESSVTTVSFEREKNADATFSIFYNTREQLKKLGVDFGRRQQYVEPNAFPGKYCEPPRN